MSISTQDRERIANAIRSAETKTSGEIVCVLAPRHGSNELKGLLVSG